MHFIFYAFGLPSTEAFIRMCSVKKMFLEFSQNSQEISKNTFFYRTPLVATSTSSEESEENPPSRMSTQLIHAEIAECG